MPSPLPAPDALATPTGSTRLGQLAGGVVILAALALSAPLDAAAAKPAGKCTIEGTKRSETLRGTRKADVICAYGGNDKIKGPPRQPMRAVGGHLDKPCAMVCAMVFRRLGPNVAAICGPGAKAGLPEKPLG